MRTIHRAPRCFAAWLVASLLSSSLGCTTFGVETVETRVTVRDPAPIGDAKIVRMTIGTEDVVEVIGGAEALAATLETTAWVSDAGEVSSVEDLQVRFRHSGDTIRIDPRYADDLAEHVTLEAAALALPDGLDVDLEIEAGDALVAGVPGRVAVTTSGGGITVSDVGQVALSSHAGPVVASLARGGSIETGGGHAEVAVTGADFDLLTIESGSGGATIQIPEGAGLTLDLLATGESATVTLEISGGRITEMGTDRVIDLNGGGPLVYVRAEDASITVRDGSWVADR